MAGVNAAIIFDQISFWVEKNRANNHNCVDGKYWTHNTVSAFEKLFPYLGSKAIRNAIQKLSEMGYIEVGEHNQKKYDRTLWYTLGSLGIAHLAKGQMDSPKRQMEIAERANGDSQKGKPIPVTNPVTNPSIKKYTKKPDSFKRFFAAYPDNKKGGRDTSAWKKARVLHLTDEHFELMITDLEQRRALCPSWFSTFAPGICKYLDEHIWKTPVHPETGQISRSSLEEDLTNTAWADGLTDDSSVLEHEATHELT